MPYGIKLLIHAPPSNVVYLNRSFDQEHVLTQIPACMINHIHCKVLGEIIYPTTHFTVHVITYLCRDLN